MVCGLVMRLWVIVVVMRMRIVVMVVPIPAVAVVVRDVIVPRVCHSYWVVHVECRRPE